MKVLPMPKLKDFKVILYERSVFHFTVKAKDEDAAHHIAPKTYYGWPLADRARYTTTEQCGVELDIEEAVQ